MKQSIGEFTGNAVVVSKLLLVMAIPTALLLFHVWNQYRITEVGYEIADVTSEHRQLLEEHKKLTVEARLQERSDRVAELARSEFGLEPMSPDQIITVGWEEAENAEHAHLDTADDSPPQPTLQ